MIHRDRDPQSNTKVYLVILDWQMIKSKIFVKFLWSSQNTRTLMSKRDTNLHTYWTGDLFMNVSLLVMYVSRLSLPHFSTTPTQ